MDKIASGCRLAEALERQQARRQALDESFRQVRRDMIMTEFGRAPLIPTKIPLIVSYA